MGLENIKNLNELNQLLNNTAAKGYDKAITVTSMGSRDFTLISSRGGDPIHAKMSEIVSTFERLAKKDPDKHLVGDIHDRIFELNAEGEKKLEAKGRAAVILRNAKTAFFRSHSKKNDAIELQYISTQPVQKKADDILQNFDKFKSTIAELTKQKNESIQKTPDREGQLLDTEDLTDEDSFTDYSDKDIGNPEGSNNTIRHEYHEYNEYQEYNEYSDSDEDIDESDVSQNTVLHEYDTVKYDKEIRDAVNSKIEYSAELLRDIFSESKPQNPAKSENTKNAIRYLVKHNPEKALDIIEALKSNLSAMSQLRSNPQEFIQSTQHFLEVQEEEIYSTTKLQRPEESGTSEVILTLPTYTDDPIANIKEQFGEKFSIVLDEETKMPMLQFKFETPGERQEVNKLVLSAIIEASEFSIFGNQENEPLPLSSDVNEETTFKLSPHSSLLLSGVSREVFLEKMYQTIWEQNEASQVRSKVLEGIIKNLTETQVKDFLSKNVIGLDSDYFDKSGTIYKNLNTNFPELMKTLEVQNGVKYFSMNDFPSPTTMLVTDYINDKSKTVPVEEKLLLFIKHANPEAMSYLLDFISTLRPETDALNTLIKIGPNLSATPISFALKINRIDIAEALDKAGATKIESHEGPTQTPSTVKFDLETGEISSEMQELIQELQKIRIENKGQLGITINDKTLSESEALDYFDNKYKNISIEDKLVLFINYANTDAMNLLLKSIFIKKNIQLDKPIRINANITATPLALAMNLGKEGTFSNLYGAGARENVIKENNIEKRFLTLAYLKNGDIIEIEPEKK